MPAVEAPIRILGTHHVAIHTPDLARLRAFYVETLGLAVVGSFPKHGILFVEAGGTILELIEEPTPDGGESRGIDPAGIARPSDERGYDQSDRASRQIDAGHRGGWSHLAWVVDDVDAAYAALAARGVPLRSPPEDFPPEAPAFRIAFVADPDGNPLELLRPLAAAD
jgi:catechol 2,3-dioxygenase-like lactoylglutathione lyase family enzyme